MTDSIILPMRKDLAYGGKVEDPLEAFDVRPYRLGLAAGIDELLGEYTFFTPALAYCHGFFQDVFWADLIRDAGRDVSLTRLRFSTRLFDGVTSKDGTEWGNQLWAVAANDWPIVERHVSSIVLSNLGGLAGWYFWQELRIPDPVRREKDPLWPGTVPVHAIVVSGPSSKAVFSTKSSPPRPVRKAAEGRTQAAGAALASGVDPYAAGLGVDQETAK